MPSFWSPLESFLASLLGRFSSPSARLAREGDIQGLLQLASQVGSRSRADALNRLWGLSDRLSEEQREGLAAIARTALHDEDEGVRAQAIFALGNLRNPDDLERLEGALGDKAWFPRLAAAYALGWQRPVPTEAIRRLSNDPEAFVRDQVAEILSQDSATGPEAATPDATAVGRRGAFAEKGQHAGGEGRSWVGVELRHFGHDLPRVVAWELGITALVIGFAAATGVNRLDELALGLPLLWVALTPMYWLHAWRYRLQPLGTHGWILFVLSAVWATLVISAFGLASGVVGG